MTPTLHIPAQPAATATLSRAVADRQIGHALAFVGQPGLGQTEGARAVAAGLNCPVDPAGCGHCADCRRALRGAHPALFEFAPTGAFHRVAEVRDTWLPAAFTTAARGAWKVLRILEADRMNDSSANAFLKALEEPPPRTTWILDIADPDELPDTIISRCRVVQFQPWNREVFLQEAAQAPADLRESIVRASLGSPERLRVLQESWDVGFAIHRQIPRRLRQDGPGHAIVAARAIDAEVRERTDRVKALAKKQLAELDELYGSAPPKPVRKQVEDAAARREREARTVVVAMALDDLAVWLRDVLAVRGGADPDALICFDDADGLRADADALTSSQLLQMLDVIAATRESLEFNIQQQLALEALFLQLSAVAIAP